MTATAHFADPRNEQIRLMQPLVRRVARHLRAQLPPSVDVDDLIQAGLIGLNEAIGRCDPAEAEAGVFRSATVCGDYTYVSSFRPEGNMSRDDTLFKDDDGTAYFISAANENADLVIYELTDDYLDIEREVITLWKGSWREAPAMMKVDGVYFLVTSGATG